MRERGWEARPRTRRRGAGWWGLCALLAGVIGCSRTPAQPRAEAARERHVGTSTPGPVSADAEAPPATPRKVEADSAGACVVPTDARAAPGWTLTGFRPGPVLHEVVAASSRRLAARTANRICTSDDGGEHWTERLCVGTPGGVLTLARVDERRTWLAVERRAPADDAPGAVAHLWLSRDGGLERWTPLPLPAGVGEVRAAVADGLGRLFLANERQLFESADGGATWLPPRALPGREAREVDACGPLLIARARVDQDWFYHRSFDHGATWRPFRLGAIGLEGNTAMLRCVTARGGVEAGRGPLPSHWSFDGGLTWRRAGYDAQALRVAQAAAETRGDTVTPRCSAGPGHTIACADAGRLRLLSASGRAQEIHAPAGCSRVAQVDARRTYAFGPGCGLYVSTDRGGLWRMISQALAARAPVAYAEGRGGFIDGRTAWRLDGGVWWSFDGGAHWRPFYSVLGRTLERGVFVDARRGVFATSTGWVVATRDGGRTWTYVLRGEVERIASARRHVLVTTTQAVRVSPDGGVTWLSTGAQPPEAPLDPTVELRGTERMVAVGPGVRVVQREDRVVLERAGAPPRELARGLPPGYQLLAAREDRVLLEGGAVIARE